MSDIFICPFTTHDSTLLIVESKHGQIRNFYKISFDKIGKFRHVDENQIKKIAFIYIKPDLDMRHLFVSDLVLVKSNRATDWRSLHTDPALWCLIGIASKGISVWKHFSWWRHQNETFSALPCFCARIHRPPVNSPHKGQWRGALMFSLICAWINGWVNNRKTGDLRRNRAHYDVIVMFPFIHD